MYKCPVCGSGSGRSGTGALHIYPDSNRVFCYAGNCFTDKGEDTIGALRIIWQCDETEALKRAGYSLDYEAPAHQEHKKSTEHQEHKPEAADYSLFYRKWHQDLKESPEALEYLHGRGITDDSIERFNLGYCATWKHTRAGEKVAPTRRIIIPRTKGTYTARRIDKPASDISRVTRTFFLKKLKTPCTLGFICVSCVLLSSTFLAIIANIHPITVFVFL